MGCYKGGGYVTTRIFYGSARKRFVTLLRSPSLPSVQSPEVANFKEAQEVRVGYKLNNGILKKNVSQL